MTEIEKQILVAYKYYLTHGSQSDEFLKNINGLFDMFREQYPEEVEAMVSEFVLLAKQLVDYPS